MLAVERFFLSTMIFVVIRWSNSNPWAWVCGLEEVKQWCYVQYLMFFCRVLTSQSMLWRRCHVAEFDVWKLLAGEVRCRSHSPSKNCVKCWPFRTAWRCVTHRTLKLSVLWYQVSAVLSLRLLAVPFSKYWLLIQNVCNTYACFLHVWSWNLYQNVQFILLMATTIVSSTFFVLRLYLNPCDFHESGTVIGTKFTSVDKFYEHFFLPNALVSKRQTYMSSV